MKNKKKITLGVLIISIILVIVAVVSTTQAYFSNDAYANNPTEYQTGVLSIEAVSKSSNISLDNTLPMSDTDGLSTTPYVFTIKNNGNVDYKFDVKLLATNTNTFDSQYIKLQIDNEEVTTLSSLSDNVIKKDIILYAGKTIDISIRIWLDENTPNSQIGKSFNSKIVIDGQSIYTETNTDIITPLEDFDYYLGSEYSSITSIDYDDMEIILDGSISLNYNEVLLTKYIGESKNVVIPDTYIVGDNVYNVVLLSQIDYETTTIQYTNGIFYKNTLIESVYLGDSISIITIDGRGLTYENYAACLFFGCTSLISVPKLPSSVTCLNSTFSGCTNLTGTVKINSSNVSNVNYIFNGTTKSIEVQVPSGSTTYTNLNVLTTSNGMPSNVKLTTFTS